MLSNAEPPKTQADRLAIAPLSKSQIDGAVDLLTAMRAQIGGAQVRSVYRAVCLDAVRGREVVVVAASDGNRLAGISMALLSPHTYWRSFAKRRPLLAARIILERRRTRTIVNPSPGPAQAPARRDVVRRILAPGPPPLPWHHSHAEIARSIYLAVAPAYQARGLTRRLFDALAQELASRGIHKIDAAIDKSNIASLLAHRNAGWTLYDGGEHIYGLYE